MEGGRDVESGSLSYLTSPFIGAALRQQARLKGLQRPKGHRHHAHAPLPPPHCLRPFFPHLIPPSRLPFPSPSSFSLPPLLTLPLPSTCTPRLSLHHSPSTSFIQPLPQSLSSLLSLASHASFLFLSSSASFLLHAFRPLFLSPILCLFIHFTPFSYSCPPFPSSASSTCFCLSTRCNSSKNIIL